MTTHWAIDLGTSNTTVCEDRSGRPHVVNLPGLAKLEPITQTPVIPSVVCVMDDVGRSVLIGQSAVTYNWDGQAPGFVEGFKRHLGRGSHDVLAQVGRTRYSAQQAAELFLGELVRVLEEESGVEVSDITFATPSGFYETYRAELQHIVRRLKQPSWWRRLVARLRGRSAAVSFRTVDEPVAAALGYGVDVRRPTTLIAFDFGGGSMEAAAVHSAGSEVVETGRAEVLAKQATPLGGRDVDRWILDALVPTALHDWPEWDVALRWEAERVKLLASSGRDGAFTFRHETYGTLDFAGLREILMERGLYGRIRELLRALLDELRHRHGLSASDVDDVILEGGSTLLPDVREAVGDVLGRDKIREWLPFEAVARGACIFAAGAHVRDFVYHDYAVRLMPDGERSAEYELLIPGGTAYPTAEDFVTRYYASGYDGQERINLFVCEVGRAAGRRVAWRERSNGTRFWVPATDAEHAFSVCLNEADPAFVLDPPGRGGGPRLRVTYAVDEHRWLCVTVHDLARKEDLRVRHPVVRLR